MPGHKAKVISRGENHILALSLRGSTIEIPLSEDKPAEVRDAFNKLVVELKAAPLAFIYEKAGDDLFQEIGEEYVKQLNGELAAARKDLEEYEMVLPEK